MSATTNTIYDNLKAFDKAFGADGSFTIYMMDTYTDNTIDASVKEMATYYAIADSGTIKESYSSFK